MVVPNPIVPKAGASTTIMRCIDTGILWQRNDGLAHSKLHHPKLPVLSRVATDLLLPKVFAESTTTPSGDTGTPMSAIGVTRALEVLTAMATESSLWIRNRSLSTAMLWNNIWVASSPMMRMYTIVMVYATTTGLRILNYGQLPNHLVRELLTSLLGQERLFLSMGTFDRV